MYKTINLFFSNISCLIYHLFLINCLKKCLSKIEYFNILFDEVLPPSQKLEKMKKWGAGPCQIR